MNELHPFVDRIKRSTTDLRGPRGWLPWSKRTEPTDIELDRFCRVATSEAVNVASECRHEFDRGGGFDKASWVAETTGRVKAKLRHNKVSGVRGVITTWLIGIAVKMIVEWIIDQLLSNPGHA